MACASVNRVNGRTEISNLLVQTGVPPQHRSFYLDSTSTTFLRPQRRERCVDNDKVSSEVQEDASATASTSYPGRALTCNKQSRNGKMRWLEGNRTRNWHSCKNKNANVWGFNYSLPALRQDLCEKTRTLA